MVTVYLAKDGSYRIVPYHQTTMGVGIAGYAVDVLDSPADEELGARVLAALDTAGRVVPHPHSQEEWSAHTRSFVRAMGYRSHRQLMSANSAVVVSRQGDAVLVLPTDNLGTRGGYSHRSDRSTVVVARPSAVGKAIRAAEASALT